MDTDKEFLKALGTRLRAERIAAGLKQDDLAAKIGVSARTIIRYEAGKQDIGISALYAIAEAIGVDAQDVIEAAFRRAKNS